MAQTGQRVILGEDADPRPIPTLTARQAPPDCRFQPTRGLLHREPVTGDRLADPGGRLSLFERRLGIGVDAVGQVEDLCAVLFQGRGQALLGLGERLCRAGGGKRDGH